MKSTDVQICGLACHTEHFAYRSPMKFGGRVVTDVTLMNVTAEVQTRACAGSQHRGTGRGSMTMGNVWGWPSKVVSADQTLEAMVRLAKAVVEDARNCTDFGHPLELCDAISQNLQRLADGVVNEMGLAEPMPRLAQLVAISPLESAIHDAYGRALNANSYTLLGEEFVNRDLSYYLNDDFKGEYLDRYVLSQIKPSMPLYHLVGALDPLTDADIPTRLNDGLPETLGEWVVADGLTHLKIKLNGDDLDWDIQRIVEIESVVALAKANQRQNNQTQENLTNSNLRNNSGTCTGTSTSTSTADTWVYSADFNEKCQSVDYVLEWLARVGELSPEALRRLQYIEQPTNRDLKLHPENTMHEAARIKQVVIDESLVDFQSLLLSRQMGYSGVALKACKGHGEALMMGAAAQKYGMFLCVQDLTCPGMSFLHSASLSARVPGVAAIEGNGRQYCPAANEPWKEAFPKMFEITDGTVKTAELAGPGLGY